jgi:hypothetical protein
MRREPVLIAGVVIVALRWIVAALGAEWHPEYEEPVMLAVDAVITLGVLVVARQRTMPVRTIEDAGLSAEAIKTRAENSNAG